jgi:RimJ/RimL family protein N-acetyltransferase
VLLVGLGTDRVLPAAGIVLLLTGLFHAVSRRRPWWLIDDEGRPPLPDLGAVTTPRLRVRPARPADAEGLVATVDDAMREANGWRDHEVAALVREVRRRGGGPGWYVELVLEAAADGTIVGGLSLESRPDAAVALGWWLGPDHRGQGLGTEAVTAVCATLLGAGVPRVEIATDEANTAVQRVVARVGGVEVRRELRELPDGRVARGVVYAVAA